jgi:PhnB protein
MKLNTYLAFDGTCEAAFNFYQRCLGGELVAMMKYSGSPMAAQTPAEWRDKIMHARLIVDGEVLMGSDAPPGRHEPPKGFHASINVDTAAEAERIYAALSEGGSIVMPLQETFWATRFGMFSDRFGTPWMINVEKPLSA